MTQARAWILPAGAGKQAAVGNRHMMQYIAAAEVKLVPLPLAPRYAAGLMVWRQQILPVIDIAELLEPGKNTGTTAGIMVLAYQEGPGEPLKHGAVALCAAPKNVWVSNDMARPIPGDHVVWRSLAVACFSHEGRLAPVLDVARLFSGALRAVYRASCEDSRARDEAGRGPDPNEQAASGTALTGGVAFAEGEIDKGIRAAPGEGDGVHDRVSGLVSPSVTQVNEEPAVAPATGKSMTDLPEGTARGSDAGASASSTGFEQCIDPRSAPAGKATTNADTAVPSDSLPAPIGPTTEAPTDSADRSEAEGGEAADGVAFAWKVGPK